MPITKNFKLGTHEQVTLVEFGTGDIGVTTAKAREDVVFNQIAFSVQDPRPFGEIKTFPPGTNSDAIDQIAVVFIFDSPESVNVLIRALSEIQKNLFLSKKR